MIDNLERAIEHAGKTEEAKAIAEGVALTLNGFLKVLEKFDVKQSRGGGARNSTPTSMRRSTRKRATGGAGDSHRRVPEGLRDGREAAAAVHGVGCEEA